MFIPGQDYTQVTPTSRKSFPIMEYQRNDDSPDEEGESDSGQTWPDDAGSLSPSSLPAEPQPAKAIQSTVVVRSIADLLSDTSKDFDINLAPIQWKDSVMDSQATVYRQKASDPARYLPHHYAPLIQQPIKPNSYQGGPYPYYHPYSYYPYPHQYYNPYGVGAPPSQTYSQQRPKPTNPPVPQKEKPKRNKKDPGAPKHPMSAFLYYLSARRPKYSQRYPEYGVGMISKLIAREWKNMSDDQKLPYLKQSEEDKCRYSREMRVWNKLCK